MKAGYTLVDCTGIDLTKGSTEQNITGIYNKVVNAMNTGKMIIAENLNWDGATVTPVQVFAIDFTNVIICTASTLQVRVTPADKVTIVNLAPANE